MGEAQIPVWVQSAAVILMLGWMSWLSITAITQGRTLSKLLQWKTDKDAECVRRYGWMQTISDKIDKNNEDTAEIKGCVKTLLKRSET